MAPSIQGFAGLSPSGDPVPRRSVGKRVANSRNRSAESARQSVSSTTATLPQAKVIVRAATRAAGFARYATGNKVLRNLERDGHFGPRRSVFSFGLSGMQAHEDRNAQADYRQRQHQAYQHKGVWSRSKDMTRQGRESRARNAESSPEEGEARSQPAPVRKVGFKSVLRSSLPLLGRLVRGHVVLPVRRGSQRENATSGGSLNS